MTYEAGLLVAFFVWVWSVGSRIVTSRSLMAKNLAKVGQRVSWSTGAFTPEPPVGGRGLKRFLLLATVETASLLFVLTSWLYVFIVGAMMLSGHWKDRGAPEAIRTFRWKLRNIDMGFDDLLRELMKVSGDPPERFLQVKAEVLQILEQRRLNA